MLTAQQLQTLKTAILAHDATPDEHAELLYFNGASDPAFVVWRTLVTQDEIMQNGFDWTRVDNLSVGKARVWEWMFANEFRSINPAKANIQAGINAVWVGTQADLDVRAAVYVHCKRTATRAEKLFATGTGSSGSPGTMTFEGELTLQEIIDAINLP